MLLPSSTAATKIGVVSPAMVRADDRHSKSIQPQSHALLGKHKLDHHMVPEPNPIHLL
jgi:hypothetical protein